MYANNVNTSRGESLDRDKRDEYFLLALEGYGDKFSVEADAARSFIAFSGDAELDDSLNYYDWLLTFEGEPKSDQVYPVQPISEYVGYAQPIQQTAQEMQLRVGQLRRISKQLIPAAENAVLRRNRSPQDLAIMAEKYPERRIGQIAKQRLEEQIEEVLDVNSVFDDASFVKLNLDGSEERLAGSPIQSTSLSSSNTATESHSSGPLAKLPVVSRYWAVFVFGFVVIAFVVFVLRRNRVAE